MGAVWRRCRYEWPCDGNAGIGAFSSDVHRDLADSALATQLTGSASIVGLDWTFSPWLSLQLFLQPFAASGAFTRFKEFTTARQFTFAEYGTDRGAVTVRGDGSRRIDPDGSGAAPSFVVPNQDFTVRELRGNAVLRWEYRPGSSIFLVWTQQREESLYDVQSNVGSQALRTIADPGRHVFLIEFSRWIGR